MLPLRCREKVGHPRQGRSHLASQQTVSRSSQAVALQDVRVRQGHVALHHVERCMAQDPLQAKRIAAIHQVGTGECVPQGVRAAASGEAGPQLQPAEELLDATPAKRAATARTKDRPVSLTGIVFGTSSGGHPASVAANLIRVRHTPSRHH